MENTYGVIKLKEKYTNRKIDKNFFRQMSYEIAAEHGIIDNEDMKNNRKLNDQDKEDQKNNKS